MWSSTQILWDQQILLLWILLPPVFIVCGLLALAAPYIVRTTERYDDTNDEEFVSGQAVIAEKSR